MNTVYYAQWMLAPDGTVIVAGAVVVSGSTIAYAGPRTTAPRTGNDRIVNLGDALLLPGLINAHTHLEEGVLRGFPRQSDDSFAAWLAKKNTRMNQAPAASIVHTIKLSVRELLANGTTTVVDSSRSGISGDILADEPVNNIAINELHADDTETEDILLNRTAHVPGHRQSGQGGLGPYALFSLSPDGHQHVLTLAKKNQSLWMCHCAESAEELQAFAEQQGDLYFRITRRRSWPYGAPGRGSLHYALQNNLIPSGALCVHGTYASSEELQKLADLNAAVIICGQYTEAMGHKNFPLEAARNRGCTLCLGSESLPDSRALNMFDELHWFKQHYPHIPARELLQWVTVNPAKALNAQNHIGALAAGFQADIIAARFSHAHGSDILEELCMEQPEITLVVVKGEELIVDL